ncbi:hypothetical protein SARC_17297, partial [Sphaeroforma arctica JP610]
LAAIIGAPIQAARALIRDIKKSAYSAQAPKFLDVPPLVIREKRGAVPKATSYVDSQPEKQAVLKLKVDAWAAAY